MDWNVELIVWAGHRYDPRVLAAPMELVVARSQIDHARSAGRGVGMLGLRSLEISEILLARVRNVHRATEPRTEGTPCSCGLVVPEGVALSQATGHLDLRTWEPASVLVVSDSTASAAWGAEYVDCRAYCQSCGWLDRVRDRYGAAGAGEFHQCCTALTKQE